METKTLKKFDKDNMTGHNHMGVNPNMPLRLLTANSIIGDKVFNKQNKPMGAIHDIMIDVYTGKIEYYVLELGGFLGIGEKFFAIPFPMLKIDLTNETYILDQKQETLNEAPGFDKNHWPSTNDHIYESGRYWGTFMGSNVGSPY